MKKIVSLFIALLFSYYLDAQVENGKILIGMSTTLSSVGTGPEMFGAGFSSTQTKVGSESSAPTKSYGVNVVPKVGYFIIDKLALGFDINFSYSSMDIESTEEFQSTTFGGIGLFSRYYLPFSRIYPFFEIDAGMGKAFIKYQSQNSSSDSQSFFYNLGAGIGLAIPLGEKVALDFLAGYDFIKELPDETYYNQKIQSSIHSLGIEIGLMISL